MLLAPCSSTAANLRCMCFVAESCEGYPVLRAHLPAQASATYAAVLQHSNGFSYAPATPPHHAIWCPNPISSSRLRYKSQAQIQNLQVLFPSHAFAALAAQGQGRNATSGSLSLPSQACMSAQVVMPQTVAKNGRRQHVSGQALSLSSILTYMLHTASGMVWRLLQCETKRNVGKVQLLFLH